jgi:hypothetical protein
MVALPKTVSFRKSSMVAVLDSFILAWPGLGNVDGS